MTNIEVKKNGVDGGSERVLKKKNEKEREPGGRYVGINRASCKHSCKCHAQTMQRWGGKDN